MDAVDPMLKPGLDPIQEEQEYNCLLSKNGTMDLIKLLYNGHFFKDSVTYEELSKGEWDVSLISEQVGCHIISLGATPSSHTFHLCFLMMQWMGDRHHFM